jgi:hypothetical protein
MEPAQERRRRDPLADRKTMVRRRRGHRSDGVARQNVIAFRTGLVLWQMRGPSLAEGHDVVCSERVEDDINRPERNCRAGRRRLRESRDDRNRGHHQTAYTRKMVRPPSLELGTPGLGNREHGTISLRI